MPEPTPPRPAWRDELRGRLGALRLRPEREAEIVEELAQHLDDRYDELRLTLDEEAARRQALDELAEPDAPGRLTDGLAAVESTRTAEPLALGSERSSMLGTLGQDVRFAGRSIARHRGVAAVVVVTLALAIGATTAIFSVVDGVLLKPLPYADVDRMVALAEQMRSGERMSIAWPNFVDWRDRNRTFEALGVYRYETATLTGTDRAERVDASLTSSAVFGIVGVPPRLGRTLQPADDQAGAPRVAVLSERLWRRRFGADPGIVGRPVSVDGQPYQIVGVMPPPMRFPARTTDLWLGLGAAVDTFPRERGNHPGLNGIGKLRPGVSYDDARADLDRVARALEKEYPASNQDHAIWTMPYRELVVRRIRPALVTLLAAVSFVLLIGCANLANLLLARAEGRRREIAVRRALGASRRRVVQQLMTENALLALLGGALGCGLAALGVRAFVASSPTSVPRVDLLTVDGRVLAFAAAVSLAAALLFGLAPALRASSDDVATPLKEAGRGAPGGRRRARAALVVAEVSLALMLLVGAGLLLRSFQHLLAIELGFAPDHVVTMRVTLPNARYPELARWQEFHQRLLERVRTLPGVELAAWNSAVPLDGGGSESSIAYEGETIGPNGPTTECSYQAGTADYFRVLGIQLLRGRALDDRDTETSTPVAVVDESLVRRMFPSSDPIGRRVAFEDRGTSRETSKPLWREIVGVVRHVRYYGLTEEPPYVQVYVPLRQLPIWNLERRPSMVLVARTTADAETVAAAVRRETAALDPDVPVYDVQSMRRLLRQPLEQPRLSVVLLGAFAVLAALLAALGVYGVLSQLVSARRHELGVRMALGATRADLLRLVVGRGMALTAIGIAVGLTAAAGLSRTIRGLLYDVSPHDPTTYVVVAFGLGLVAFVACYAPARRAARLDPLRALHHE